MIFISLLMSIFVSLEASAASSLCRESAKAPEAKEASASAREIWLAFARATTAHSDYKYLSDLVFRHYYNEETRRELILKAKDYRQDIFEKLVRQGMPAAKAARRSQTAYSRRILESLFENKTELRNVNPEIFGPRRILVNSSNAFPELPFAELQALFNGLEATWPTLVKRLVAYAGGSLIGSAYPATIAGGRFREPYYWDTHFGAIGLFLTGRFSLAFMQLKRFVDDIESEGLIRNGRRTYYTRSQPPVVSLLARKVLEHSSSLPMELRQEVENYLTGPTLRALEKDYSEFWMAQRRDEATGLNHFSDALDTRRPERHSNDDKKQLAKTYLDERAEAEDGGDFSGLNQGAASRTLPVKLNAFLFAYEKDLGLLYRMKAESGVGPSEKLRYLERAEFFEDSSRLRKFSMDRFMRSPDGLYRYVNRDSLAQRPGLSGEIFSLLVAKALTLEQAAEFIPAALKALERDGGIAASTLKGTKKQWDGDNGWAPFQMMAIEGLRIYHNLFVAVKAEIPISEQPSWIRNYDGQFLRDADRLSRKILKTGLNIFNLTGQFYERTDVSTMGLPKEDASKYPNQVGFLWTNASLIYALHVLGFKFEPEPDGDSFSF